MNEQKHELETWCKEMQTYHIPRWDELPDFELYMDQVISFIEKCLSLPLGSDSAKIITPAMINNYVKLKMIPAPHRKKYARKHLAYLIAISFLKQVITISEIKDGINYQFQLHGAKKSYDIFCEEQERALRLTVLREQITSDKEEKLENLAMRMATISFSSKVFAEKAIKIQRAILASQQPQRSER